MFKKNLINISDFAKLAGVSRQTLIYYDKIGLFSPAVIAENKYRMYSHNQIDIISIITILCDLGVPLKKIKNILNDLSLDTMSATLSYQLSVLNKKIQKLSTLKNMTEVRLNQIKTGEKYLNGAPQFSIVEVSKEIPFFAGQKIGYNQKELTDETITDFFECAEHSGLPPIFSFGYIKKANNVIGGDFSTVERLGFRLKNEDYANDFLPVGKYIVGYGKGDYGNSNDFYEELLLYTKQNGLTLIGDVYEEYLIDELSEKNPENFVFQVTARIKDND